MASRKNRDQMVIATKYTSAYPSGKGGEQIKANFQGNHAKSMHLSLDASLKKLRTSYIDLVSLNLVLLLLISGSQLHLPMRDSTFSSTFIGGTLRPPYPS